MMNVHRWWFVGSTVLLGAAALAGCRFPTELFFAPDSPPPSQIETLQPTATSPALSGDAGPSPTPTNLPCAFAQAEQGLPEVTAKLQDQLSKAGLGAVEAMAVAYGENCVDTLNNEVISFSAIETDFYFTVPVPDSSDATTCGNYTLRLLNVVESFPPGKVPGLNLGYLTIVFQDSQQTSRLRATLKDALAARDRGLHGAELFQTLGGN